jgi:hypothetical protein
MIIFVTHKTEIGRRVLHFRTICRQQLDGSLAGDEGFDPLGLSNIEELGIGEIEIRGH